MRTLNLCCAVCLACLLYILPAQADPNPTDNLKPSLTKLTNLLSDPSLKGDDHKAVRREKIMSSIKEGFDFQEMSKRILGAEWNNISGDEQKHFTTLMTKLLENVYIGKLEGYSGQAIDYVGEKIKDGRAQVATVIENNGQKIPISYIMMFNNTKWMVYDINIEGVSLIRNYMEQFKSILRTEKYAGLIRVIEEKNQSFESGAVK